MPAGSQATVRLTLLPRHFAVLVRAPGLANVRLEALAFWRFGAALAHCHCTRANTVGVINTASWLRRLVANRGRAKKLWKDLFSKRSLSI